MLVAHHLQNRSLAMLEEDDHLGITCRKGAAANINGVHIRKRSLELNTMGGSFWAGVERKLQEQERKMAPSLNRWLAEGLAGCWLDVWQAGWLACGFPCWLARWALAGHLGTSLAGCRAGGLVDCHPAAPQGCSAAPRDIRGQP